MEKTKIRVGLAGFGMSGQVFHAPFLEALPMYEICKIYERATKKAKEKYPNAKIVRDFSDILTKEIDLIVISTPNALHYQMAREAILARKHVVVEKPLTVTSEEVNELIALAKERKVVLTVYQNRRLDGDFKTVEKIVSKKLLGDIVDVEIHFDRFVTEKSKKQWKETGENGTGILYDLGVHIIDQAIILFGIPNEVYGDLRIIGENRNAINSFSAILYYDKCHVRVSASQTVREKGPHFILHGTRGSFVKYGMDVQEQALIDGEAPTGDLWGIESPEQWGNLHTEIDGLLFYGKIKTEIGDYRLFYENLYDAICDEKPLMILPEQARDVLYVIEAIAKSSKDGCKIYLS